MSQVSAAAVQPRFDPVQFAVHTPLASPRELATAFGMLIDSIADMTATSVERIITPGLSAVTVSWSSASVPSETWLADVEDQLQAFAVCSGVQVRFRRH